jgi:hypothetical protein
MSILGRLMGTAENTARTAARSGRTGRGMPRSTGRTSTGRGYGRATTGRAGRGRATPAASGLGGLIGGLLAAYAVDQLALRRRGQALPVLACAAVGALAVAGSVAVA